MKKSPAILYEKATSRKPFLGLMAVESQKRRIDYLSTGCNAFSKDRPQSQPIAFWTEQDVLSFLCINHDKVLQAIKIDAKNAGAEQTYIDNLIHPWAPVYGELIKMENGKYKFTENDRTGCMFCMYGCHMEEKSRFVSMKETHPNQYKFCMKPWNEKGLGMDMVLNYIEVKH